VEDIFNQIEELSDMHMDIDSKISSTYTCKLDTCTSTHMTSDIDFFEVLQPCEGMVGVEGGILFCQKA